MADTEASEYCAQTGRLRILKGGAPLRGWFPPNSWIAIASVAGARNWETRPDSNENRVAGEPDVAAAYRVVVAGVFVSQPELVLPLPTEKTADGRQFASERMVVSRRRECSLAAINHFFAIPSQRRRRLPRR